MLHQLVCTCMMFTAISISSPSCAKFWAFQSYFVFPRQAKRHMYFIVQGKIWHSASIFIVFLYVACCKKLVKVSTFSLCGMHWCVVKLWYSGYVCHNVTEAEKSVCSGGKLWFVAGILHFPLPCKVQYTSKTNSIIHLPSKSEAFSIQSWSFTPI
jgi:hypothetical protein